MHLPSIKSCLVVWHHNTVTHLQVQSRNSHTYCEWNTYISMVLKYVSLTWHVAWCVNTTTKIAGKAISVQVLVVEKKLLSHLNTHCVSFWQFECLDVMAELPSGLLEACVVVGGHSDKLRDIHQVCMQTDSQSKDGWKVWPCCSSKNRHTKNKNQKFDIFLGYLNPSCKQKLFSILVDCNSRSSRFLLLCRSAFKSQYLWTLMSTTWRAWFISSRIGCVMNCLANQKSDV